MMLIDFYSRYPRWLFRSTDAKRPAFPGRNACRNTIGSEGQRVAERPSQRQPIDVAHFHKERFHELFDEWQSLVRRQAVQMLARSVEYALYFFELTGICS